MAKKNEEVTEAEVVEEHPESVSHKKRNLDGRAWFGLFLVFIGVMFIIQNVFSIDAWHYFWPVVFVIFGVLLISNSFKR